MGTVAIVVIVVVVVLVIAGVAAFVLAQRRRRRELAEEFGPEYERRVAETGDRKAAEAELRERRKRHDQHELRPLEPAERERFRADWQQVQRGFVDDPGGAVEHADALVVTIMRTQGYPVEDGQRRADDLSVAHPQVVEHYREATRVAHAHREGSATTEDLRAAITSFRTLIETLLGDDRHGEGSGRGDGGGAAPDAPTQRIDPGGGAPDAAPGQAPGQAPDAATRPVAGHRDGHEEPRR